MYLFTADFISYMLSMIPWVTMKILLSINHSLPCYKSKCHCTVTILESLVVTTNRNSVETDYHKNQVGEPLVCSLYSVFVLLTLDNSGLRGYADVTKFLYTFLRPNM